jgi:hypothetical protein
VVVYGGRVIQLQQEHKVLEQTVQILFLTVLLDWAEVVVVHILRQCPLEAVQVVAVEVAITLHTLPQIREIVVV